MFAQQILDPLLRQLTKDELYELRDIKNYRAIVPHCKLK